MTELPAYGVPDGAAERRVYASAMAQSFGGTLEVFEPWVEAFGAGVRVLRDDGVKAGLVIYEMGQYFGGRSIPCWGIAGVAVSPELRSSGYAHKLMAENLRENFEQGPPLSALYPAAPRLYRNLGWEFAGSRHKYTYPIATLARLDGPVVLRPATADDAELLRGLYARRYRNENGCLDRSEKIWERVKRTPKENPVFTYVAEHDGEPVGYTTYFQKREGGSFHFDLHVRDLVCLNREVAQAFVTFFAGHRSVADNLHVYAAPDDPLLIELQQTQEIRQTERMDWMLRVVRVKDALEARGYSSCVTGHAEIKLIDELLPENAGNWVLKLDAGKVQAERGGAGEAELDVRGLGALYSGRFAPAQLRAAGLLRGGEASDAALSAMFAGTVPWMPDYF